MNGTRGMYMNAGADHRFVDLHGHPGGIFVAEKWILSDPRAGCLGGRYFGLPYSC